MAKSAQAFMAVPFVKDTERMMQPMPPLTLVKLLCQGEMMKRFKGLDFLILVDN